MEKFIKIIFCLSAVFFLQACSEELIVDEVLSSVESGAVLRNLGETNNLDIEVMTSTYSITLEAQDAQGGSLLSEVRVNVGFNDIDDMGTDTIGISLFQTIPASEFNETSTSTHNLPVATFSTTLGDLLGHINSTQADVSPGDNFIIDFEMVLTDGRVFNVGNATGDVTRTGRFSFFNAQFRYTPPIRDPQRLVLVDLRIDDDNGLGILSSGDTDTVFVEFDRDDAFVVAPTITELSSENGNSTVTTTLQQMDDDANIYFFIYSAGSDLADTVGFSVAGGETVAGLPMIPDTLKAAYIIDNVAPSATIGDRSVALNAMGEITNVTVELLFSEELAKDLLSLEITSGGFESQMVNVSVAEGDMSMTISFVPKSGENLIPDSGLDFNIVTATGISDLVGNRTPGASYNVQIFD